MTAARFVAIAVRFVAVAAVALAVAPRPAAAWEAQTTHAGITEQAANASHLHRRIREQLGLARGIYTALTVPPADAQSLFAVLARLNPSHGFVPDRRGRQRAVGWLVAGSVIADTPVAFARNHFYDPVRERGLDGRGLDGVARRARAWLRARWVATSVPEGSGVAAPDWLVSSDNPLGLAGFLDQYAKAVRSRTPGERSRHLAGALVAAGALLHVLQDMASPSHVRNDLRAHLESMGQDGTDVGSRFERVAALGYGRLGVPAATRVVVRDRLRDFVTAGDGYGLADLTARAWFSAGTLPGAVTLRPKERTTDAANAVRRRLVYELPAIGPRLDLRRAAAPDGGTLTSDDNVCLARYRLVDRVLRWSIDDTCYLEQVSALLPDAVAYSAGLLDWLFRGAITLHVEADQVVAAVGEGSFGEGTIELFWDDGRGIRTAHLAPLRALGGEPGSRLAIAPLPPDARAIAALFTGTDANDEPLIATGYLDLASRGR